MPASSIAIHWNPDESFWVLHPAVKTIKAFYDLFKSDKSQHKRNSSKLMWAIAMFLESKEENPWRNLNVDDRKALIAEDFLGDKNFNWEQKTVAELITTYENHITTLAEKELFRLEEKLHQRSNFIAKTDYTLDGYDENGKLQKGTVDQLDKMVLNTGKLFEQIETIKSKISEDSAKGSLRGGEIESASEGGLI
jgi:hypothetical protein